jgi:hypothetical protein
MHKILIYYAFKEMYVQKKIAVMLRVIEWN